MMKTVIITGISGTLGQALGAEYVRKGWRVIGVSRKENLQGACFHLLHTNAQVSVEDASRILQFNPDLIILNAGEIETEVGSKGEPMINQFESIMTANFLFPARLTLTASGLKNKKYLQIVAIGSIADGSPSCFGPVYHVSKIALHYFISGSGPILHYSNPRIRLRLYRPGAIKGPLAWAPVLRLNEKGYRIRAQRVNNAPEAALVARKIVNWIQSSKWIGTCDEPLSFRILKYFFVLAPDMFYRIQIWAWLKGSKYSK